MTLQTQTSNDYGRKMCMLMIGAPGTGKSTLTKAVTASMTEQWSSCYNVTRSAMPHYWTFGDISVEVCDTGGLLDYGAQKGTILRLIQYTNYDAIVVCIKLIDAFNSAKEVLNFIDELGPDIWSKVHIALTHTDMAQNDDDANNSSANWKKGIHDFLRKKNHLLDIPIHNTTCTGIKTKLKILNNWLPRFLINLLYSQKYFTSQTILTIAADHPIAGQAVQIGIAKTQGRWFPSFQAGKMEDLITLSKRGYQGCQELCKVLKDM